MLIKFTKMHGLGNDFIVIDNTSQDFELSTEQIRFLADRHFGVGCDQLLMVESPQKSGVDFRYRIFNADGGEVEQCGNGARCFARFVTDKGLTRKNPIRVETLKGDLELQVEDNGHVTVNMGIPAFKPQDIPFLSERQSEHYLIEIGGQEVDMGVVALGNPHAVTLVEDIESAPVDSLGPLIENNSAFPKRINAGFMQILSRDAINVRVYERGAGETMACGSGACAAVVIGQLWKLLDERVQVHLRGGTLLIRWQGLGTPVMMSGPAQTVFEGSIDL